MRQLNKEARMEMSTQWLATLKELMDQVDENLAEFSLDGTDDYNKRAIEFLLSPLKGHISSLPQYTLPEFKEPWEVTPDDSKINDIIIIKKYGRKPF